MELSGSRKPPPTVAPVEIGGVRFEQVMDTTGIETDDHRGWMRATDISAGQVLWTRQIYRSKSHDQLEASSGLVYFSHMSVGPDGAIIVENESGARFSVDGATGDATPLN